MFSQEWSVEGGRRGKKVKEKVKRKEKSEKEKVKRKEKSEKEWR